jgi:hypothetical protein
MAAQAAFAAVKIRGTDIATNTITMSNLAFTPILSTDTLQAGATFYVASGTVAGLLTATTAHLGYIEASTVAAAALYGDGSGLTGVQAIESDDFIYHWNNTWGAGRIYGGSISPNGDGTVAITAGKGMIKSSSTVLTDDPPTSPDAAQISTNSYVMWSTLASLPLTDNAYNYIYYEGATGQLKATTNFYAISYYRDFILGRAYRTGNNVIVRLCGTNLWNFNRRVQLFGEEVFPVVHASGMAVSESPTLARGLAVTAGVMWSELVNRFETPSSDSASTPFTAWYRNGVGGFTSQSTNTISNLRYDDGGGTLGTLLTPADYGVHFIYVVHDGSIHSVYGRSGTLSLSEAQGEQPYANIPGLLRAYGTLVAKVIILKSATSISLIQSAFETVFTAQTSSEHNDLSGIQGGAAGDYQHLTSAQVSSFVPYTGATGPVNLGAYALNTSSNVTAANFIGPLTGNVTGNVTGSASLNVLKAGDTMTGALTVNNNFTVQGTTFTIANGGIGIGSAAPTSQRMLVRTADRATTLYVANDTPTPGTNVVAGSFVASGNGAASNTGISVLAQQGTSSNKAIAIFGDAGANNYGIYSEGPKSWFDNTVQASGFIGPVTGAASLNVLKAGDTMTGHLNATSGITASSLTVSGKSALWSDVGVGTNTPRTDSLHIWGKDLRLQPDSDSGGALKFMANGDTNTRNAIYNGGNDFTILKNYNQVYTLLQLQSPSGALGSTRESTIALVRGDEPNVEYLDLYNNGYTSQTQHGIRIQKRGTGSYRDFVFDQYDGSTYNPLLIMKADGKIGMNISTPTANLEVAGASGYGGTVVLSNKTTEVDAGEDLGVINFRSYDSSTGGSIVKGHIKGVAETTYTGGDHRLRLELGTSSGTDTASTRMAITGAGDIGVGTLTPAYKLDVVGGVRATSTITASGFYGPLTGNITGAASLNVLKAGDTMTGALTLAGSTLTVTGSGASSFVGSLGVGVSAPSDKLSVAGNLGTTGVIYSSGSGNNYFAGNLNLKKTAPAIVLWPESGNAQLQYANAAGAIQMQAYLDTNTTAYHIRDTVSAYNRLTVTQVGKVGIGTDQPAHLVHISSGGIYNDGLTPGITTLGNVAAYAVNASSAMSTPQLCLAGVCNTAWPSGGDNLGNHAATQQLNMGAYAIWSSSAISATRYEYNGEQFTHIFPAQYNLGLGSQAGAARATGSYNTAVGYLAARFATLGNRNTTVGYGAAAGLYYGENNSIVGAQALNYNRYGSGNSILGTQAAGFGDAGSHSISSSTLVGYQAGYNLGTNSYNNIFIGFQAGDTTTTGARNILIGNGVDALTATASDYLNIGGLIVGDMATSSATVLGSLSANSFIGPLTGSASLNVLKSGDTMTGPLTLSGSTLTVTGSAFSVGGSTFAVGTGVVRIGTAQTSSSLNIKDNARIYASANENYYSNWANSTSGGTINSFQSGVGYQQFAIDGNPILLRQGSVGIGTTAPASKLHVSSGVIYNDGTGAGFYTTGSSTAAYFYGSGAYLTGLPEGSNWTLSGEQLYANKLVGVGSITSPQYALDVATTGTSYAAQIQNNSIAAGSSGLVVTSSATATGNVLYLGGRTGVASVSDLLAVRGDGKVGIGVLPTSVYPKLTLQDSGLIGNRAKMLIQDVAGVSGTETLGVYLKSGTSSDPAGAAATASFDLASRGGILYTRINVNQDNDSLPLEAVTVSPLGAVGLGAYMPAAKLHVSSGSIRVDGTGAGFYTTGSSTAAYFYGSGANLTDLPAGGVTVSTETIVLHSGGDVFVASGTFAANIGMTHPVTYSTITITGVRCYTLITSSVAATTFNVARSTDTGATATYSYLFNTAISVAANAKYSAWSVPDQNATYSPPYALALHTIGIPASGTLPAEYGCEIKYWRRLD